MAIAIVQGQVARGSAVATISTSGMTTTVGNGGIIGLSFDTSTFSSLTDSYGNTLDEAVANTLGPTFNNDTMGERYVSSFPSGKAGASHTATLNTTGNSNNPTVQFTEVSGQDTTDMFDAASTVTDAIRNSAEWTTSAVSTVDNALQLATFKVGGGTTITPTSPFTAVASGTRIMTCEDGPQAAGSITASATPDNFVVITGYVTSWKEAAAATANSGFFMCM